MSEEAGPSNTSNTTVSGVSGSDKSAFWEENLKAELAQRDFSLPKGHPLNPNDGFREWYQKYQFLRPRNTTQFKRPRVVKGAPSVTADNNSAYNRWIEEQDRRRYQQWLNRQPETEAIVHPVASVEEANSYVEKAVTAPLPLNNGEYELPPETGTVRKALNEVSRVSIPLQGVLKGYDLFSGKGLTLGGTGEDRDYVGPGNPVYNETPSHSANRTAREHDIEYSELSRSARLHHWDSERLLRETNRVDQKAIDAFDKGHTVQDWIGALGLRIKKFAQTTLDKPLYPSLPGEQSFAFASLWVLFLRRFFVLE